MIFDFIYALFLHTFVGEKTTFSPKSLATVSPSEDDKSHNTMRAPCFANLSAVALPNPEALPVTNATKP